MGASYDAWMQWEAAVLRPPHLVCMAARSIPLEMNEVDWPTNGGFKPARRSVAVATTCSGATIVRGRLVLW
jgi:predicted acyl esterase